MIVRNPKPTCPKTIDRHWLTRAMSTRYKAALARQVFQHVSGPACAYPFSTVGDTSCLSCSEALSRLYLHIDEASGMLGGILLLAVVGKQRPPEGKPAPSPVTRHCSIWTMLQKVATHIWWVVLQLLLHLQQVIFCVMLNAEVQRSWG